MIGYKNTKRRKNKKIINSKINLHNFLMKLHKIIQILVKFKNFWISHQTQINYAINKC